MARFPCLHSTSLFFPCLNTRGTLFMSFPGPEGCFPSCRHHSPSLGRLDRFPVLWQGRVFFFQAFVCFVGLADISRRCLSSFCPPFPVFSRANPRGRSFHRVVFRFQFFLFSFCLASFFFNIPFFSHPFFRAWFS